MPRLLRRKHGHYKMSRHTTITLAARSDRARLMEVWEASVRATHHFLSESDMELLIPAARGELANIAPIYCLRDADGSVYAFMAVEQGKIEMLFVAPAHRGSGAGRQLVEYAVGAMGAHQVDVNEQNHLAVGFYERLGFRTVGRAALDPQGLPLPILRMELPGATSRALGPTV
jgi:putative acetyltransferase